MRLPDVLSPVSVEELKRDYFGKQCLLIKRKKNNPLEKLLTLKQLEARLNDGLANNAALNVIQNDGTKFPPGEFMEKQTGPAWSNNFLNKSRLAGRLNEGCSFVMHNMSALTPGIEQLVHEIERAFSSQADVHVYVSPRKGSSGYNAHKDEPQHKIYLQLFGSTDWVVYQKSDPRLTMPAAEAEQVLGVDFRATLTAGSVLYMPPGVFHYATNPDTPRVSLSIPFYPSPSSRKVDRTHIPLESMLTRGE